MKFIEQVSKAKNKILILTTREYILVQAKQKYEKMNSSYVDLAKCVVNLEQYTKIIRAKILYNHLFFSSLPEEYIQNILKDENYKIIIQHRNYNPRIIQTFTNRDIWSTIKPENFTKDIKTFLDNPESIWKHAFSNQITTLSQYVLLNMLLFGNTVTLDNLKLAANNFALKFEQKYGIRFNEFNFTKSIRELEGTFIKISKDTINNYIVEYQNPSVLDFLINFIVTSSDTIFDLIHASIYLNQLVEVFTIEEDKVISKYMYSRILLKGDLANHYIRKIIDEFDNLNYIKLLRWSVDDKSFRIQKTEGSIVEKLTQIARTINVTAYPELLAFIVEKLNNEIDVSSVSSYDFDNYAILLETLDGKLNLDANKIIEKYASQLHFIGDVETFSMLENIFPHDFRNYLEENEDLYNDIYSVIHSEIDNCDSDELESLLDTVEKMERKLDFDLGNVKKDLEIKIKDKERKREEEDEEDENYVFIPSKYDNEEKAIKDMFNSLMSEERLTTR